jgi:hypothetical protein
MKTIPLDYTVKVQCHSTNKSRKKQHNQSYLAIPLPLCKLWDLEAGRFVRLIWNGDGRVIMTKADSKPKRTHLTYPEWLRRITPFIPLEPPGTTCEEILRRAGVTQKSGTWVILAKRDIGLNNDNKDPKTHKTLWYRKSIQPNGKDQKTKEPNLRVLTLAESLGK